MCWFILKKASSHWIGDTFEWTPCSVHTGWLNVYFAILSSLDVTQQHPDHVTSLSFLKQGDILSDAHCFAYRSCKGYKTWENISHFLFSVWIGLRERCENKPGASLGQFCLACVEANDGVSTALALALAQHSVGVKDTETDVGSMGVWPALHYTPAHHWCYFYFMH